MHTRELSCDHDGGNTAASEESCPRLTLTCITGSDRIYACSIQNNNNNNMFKIKYTCTVAMHMYASAPHASVSIRVLFVWLAVHVSQTAVSVFSTVYGQCRSINNATFAEVKEACVSGGSVEEGGEGGRDSGRQREWGDGRVEGRRWHDAGTNSRGECW